MRVQIRPDGVIDVTYDDSVVTQAVQGVPAPAPLTLPVPEAAPQPEVAKAQRTTTPKASVAKAPRKARKGGSTKSSENKLAFGQIRKLVAEGDWAEAIAIAESHGWVGEADRLRERAAKAGEAKPTKQAKSRKSPKGKRIGGESKDGDGTPVYDEGGEPEAVVTPDESTQSVESLMKSLRGRAMAAVRYGKERNEPKRIEDVLKDVKRSLSAARKARKLAWERGDAAGVEGQQALVVGFADIADRLQEALDSLSESAA